MRRLLLYILVLATTAMAAVWMPAARPAAAPAPGVAPPAEDFQRGFVLGLFRKDDQYFLDREYVTELAELRELGCDSVSIVVRWFMQNGSSTEIYRRPPDTVSDERLDLVIREAGRQGLRVTLFPYVLLERAAEKEWRGNIQPTDWGAWFGAYQQMIGHYAAIAESSGVEFLCIGSELVSSETHDRAWRDVIARARALYHGKIFYSANWDHYAELSFIDATDFAAVNAYHRLAEQPSTDVAELTRAWNEIRTRVLAWQSKVGKPLLLTEVGYASVEGCSVDPWDYTREGTVALAEQAACLRAFVNCWREQPALAGVHFYVWWGPGGVADTGYTPRGKPAERVIRSFFSEEPSARDR